jgi:hypothetical protein
MRRRRGRRRRANRAGRGEGDEAETGSGSTATSQQSGARRRPMTGFMMPSGSCWKLLCGCRRCCVGSDVETTHLHIREGAVLEMV